MTSTHSLVNGEQPDHAPGLLDSQNESGTKVFPLTAPDVTYEKEYSQDTTDDHEERQEQPKLDDAKSNAHPSGARLVCIVLALVLAIFLVSLDLTIVATAIPKITDEFHGLADVSWYSAAFFMTIGGFQSAWGKIYKYFPLKISFLISIFSSSSAPSSVVSPLTAPRLSWGGASLASVPRVSALARTPSSHSPLAQRTGLCLPASLARVMVLRLS